MNILFYTFPPGHLVSDREYDRLKKGFAKVGMNLERYIKDSTLPAYDIVMVKGWSHTWDDIPHDKPVVYYSIGTEWKVGEDLQKLNEPIRAIYKNADAVVHISHYCQESHDAVFGYDLRKKDNVSVIYPACEPQLPDSYKALEKGKLKLAITAIPRPVKRIDDIEALCKKVGIELVPAYGGISDFSYYNDCDGGICLSRKEGMPNNVLEMMAYGLPCIVTNYGGAREAVGNGGIVIQNDPDHVPWNPSNIEPLDPMLFNKAVVEFVSRHGELRFNVRERVRTQLNDYVTACEFKEVFELCQA